MMLLLSCLAVAGRFTVPGHGLSWPGTYEALAHVWVGFLIAVAILRWREDEGKPAAILLSVITVYETVMFLTRGSS